MKFVQKVWMWVRGVNVENWRKLCRRCGRTGQMHVEPHSCIRFKGKK